MSVTLLIVLAVITPCEDGREVGSEVGSGVGREVKGEVRRDIGITPGAQASTTHHQGPAHVKVLDCCVGKIGRQICDL